MLRSKSEQEGVQAVLSKEKKKGGGVEGGGGGDGRRPGGGSCQPVHVVDVHGGRTREKKHT
jgi:hypothetical protein